MGSKGAKEKVLYCSFCNKSQHEVQKLIAGPSVYICNECVELCNDIITPDDGEVAKESKSSSMPTPQEIVANLDQHVIGQRVPKEILAIAVRHHYLRINNPPSEKEPVEIKKGNILLIGPTGSGKTLLAETLARTLNVPFAQEDLSGITEAGFVGGKIEGVFAKLTLSAGGDISRAEKGVVYLDEIDKISADKSEGGSQRAFRTTGVQHRILKMLESGEVEVSMGGRGSSDGEKIMLRTKNILFILGGAFEDLTRIIERRLHKGSGVGFGAEVFSKSTPEKLADLLQKVTSEDLIEFGLDPQLVGRLPNVATLDGHDEATLVRILTEPKNALLKQCARKFAFEGTTLVVDPDAVIAIAKIAMKEKTGARSLDGVCERIFQKAYFELPARQKNGENIITVHLTAEHVRTGMPPELISGNQKLLK